LFMFMNTIFLFNIEMPIDYTWFKADDFEWKSKTIWEQWKVVREIIEAQKDLFPELSWISFLYSYCHSFIHLEAKATKKAEKEILLYKEQIKEFFEFAKFTLKQNWIEIKRESYYNI